MRSNILLVELRAKDEIGCTHQGTATFIEFPKMRSAAPYGYCSGFGIPLM